MKKFFVVFCSGVMMLALTGLADAGSISGKVKFAGKAKTPKKVKITKDPKVCGTKGELIVEKLLVSDGGLQYAVLQIEGEAGDAPAVEADQNNCSFQPHVSLIHAGAKVTLNNKDGLTHNIHSFADENEAVNFAQPGDDLAHVLPEEAVEVAEIYPVKCDIHEWMNGYFAVVETPYAAISGKDGSYKIANIPDGSYTINIWHETLGESEHEVTVAGDTTLDIELSK